MDTQLLAVVTADELPSSQTQPRRRVDREWLKALKHQHAMHWRFVVRPPSLDGLVRVETRHDVLWLEDGICVHAAAKGKARTQPGDRSLLGLKLVAWTNESGELRDSFAAGCRAIFWAYNDDTATVALTARVIGFAPVLPMTTLTRPTVVVMGPSVRRAMDEEASTLPFYRLRADEPVPATLRSA